MVHVRAVDVEAQRNDAIVQESILERHKVEIYKRRRRPHEPVGYVHAFALVEYVKPDLFAAGLVHEAQCQKEHQNAHRREYQLTEKNLLYKFI